MIKTTHLMLVSIISSLLGFAAGWVYFTWRVYICVSPFDRSVYKNYILDFAEPTPFMGVEAQGTNIFLRLGKSRPAAPINSGSSKEFIYNLASIGTNFSHSVSISPDMSIRQLVLVRGTLREQGLPRLRFLIESDGPSGGEGAKRQFAELKVGDFHSYYFHQKEWFFEEEQEREARKATVVKER